ncbi:MAG TPA: DUF5946 family protein [Chitinophagaceae bacterium]|nr:DUF5946 family protein [Chitinophagaceae bacterium]
MQVEKNVVCPGCGLKLLNKNVGVSESYNVSGECMELFNELSGYTLSMTDSGFIHQYIVDAYGAQHAGGITKNIRIIFSLIGLCLAVEYNYSGRQVQLIHMKIPKQLWQVLEPPLQKSAITVADVLNVNADLERIDKIKIWAKSVWEIWSQHHEWIRNKTAEYI